MFPSAPASLIDERLVAFAGDEGGYNGIEDDEGAAVDVVPAFEGLAVEPFDLAMAQAFQGVGEFLGDGEL